MKRLTYALMILTLVWSCKSNTTDKTTIIEEMDHEAHDHADHSGDSTGIVLTAGDLTFSEVVSDPFSNASLSMLAPIPKTNVKSGKVAFDFKVGNFELGSQTGNKYADHCANSEKGQHIHLILNNGPYTAHYESTFDKELEDGTYSAGHG